MVYQKTLRAEVSLVGVGIHSGRDVNMKLKPREANTGILFVRTDLHEGKNKIEACYSNVVDTSFCTVIGNKFGANVGTIEHLMAAFSILGVTNAIVEIDSPEVPVMDGSAINYLEAIMQVGLVVQDSLAKFLKITHKLSVEEDNFSIAVKPASVAKINFELDYSSVNMIIGKQSLGIKLNDRVFIINEILKARTFALQKDIEALYANNLGLGGTLQNTVVVGDDKIFNKLRYEDEFVRHKILDAIGDFYLSGYQIIGDFNCIRSGHKANNMIVREIFSKKSNYEILQGTSVPNYAQSGEIVIDGYIKSKICVV